MTAALIIRADGAIETEHTLGLLRDRFGDLTALMGRIGLFLETTTVERFDTETAPSGERWLPSLRARTTGGKTLTDSARLKQSMTHRASADRLEVGTNVIYAGVHQGGAVITAKGGGRLGFKLPGGLGFRSPESVAIPKREFLGLSSDDVEEIDALVTVYVAEVDPGVEP